MSFITGVLQYRLRHQSLNTCLTPWKDFNIENVEGGALDFLFMTSCATTWVTALPSLILNFAISLSQCLNEMGV